MLSTVTDEERTIIKDILIDMSNGNINHYTCVSKLLMNEDNESSYRYTELCVYALDTTNMDSLYVILSNM